MTRRQMEKDKPDLRNLSLEHLQNNIAACRSIEQFTKKPKAMRLYWRECREEAEAELARRLEQDEQTLTA